MGVEVTDNKYCPIMASPGQDSGTGSFKGSLVWLHEGGAVILMSRSPHSVQRPMVFLLNPNEQKHLGGNI